MSKSLSQITFDFTGVEEPENTPTIIPVISKVEIENTAMKEPVQDSKIENPGFISDLPVRVEASRAGKRGRRSLKDIGITADLVRVPEDEVLFRKQYYSIGEVAEMFRENQSLIRYWETEFDILKPRKNRKGDRFFRPIDIKNLVLIYDLLRRRKFTIEGAKDYLRKNKKAEEKFAAIQSLGRIRAFLLELKANL